MSQRDNDLIEDILDAAGKLAEIVAAGRKNFDANWLVRSAAERQLEIIGKAAGAIELCAVLDPQWLDTAVIEYGGFDIDVAGLHRHSYAAPAPRGRRCCESTECERSPTATVHGAWTPASGS